MRVTASVSKAPTSKPKINADPAPAPAAKAAEPAPSENNTPVDNTNIDVDELPTDNDQKPSSTENLENTRVIETPKVPTKISSVMQSAIAFIQNVAPDIVDNLVVGETPIIPIAVEMIEWAETNVLAGKLTGQEKKRIVINVLIWLVDHQEEVLGVDLGYEKEQMKDIVQHVLPSVIDMIIAATKGKVLVNKFAQTTKTCLNICCP